MGTQRIYETLLHKKKDHINEIKEMVGKKPNLISGLLSKKRPLNIAVIGAMGTGKSAFINSLFAAFSFEKWRMYSRSGPSSGGTARTVFNTLYPQLRELEAYKEYLMPNIIDVAGFPNEDDDKWVEVLQVLFYGRLPSDETINCAAEFYDNMQGEEKNKEYARSMMRQRYNVVYPSHIIDRIIFVGSYTEDPPTNLIKSVIHAARPTGRLSDYQRPDIPVFGIMAKVDLLISEERAQERRSKFMEELVIDSTMFLSFSNYCEDMDRELDFDRTKMIHPKIDVPILKFLVQVCDPLIAVINPHLRDKPVPQVTLERADDRRTLQPANSKYLFYAVLLLINIFVAAISVIYFAQIPIDATEFRAVCLQVADQQINNTVMEKLCKATDGGLSFHYNYIFATALTFSVTLFTVLISYAYERFM